MSPIFRARDFIETHSGLAFALIVDQVEGELLRGTLRYRREASGWVKLSTAEAQRCLQRDHPALLVHEPRFDAILPGIPMQQVARHHRAELRLGEIMALAPNQVEAGSLEHKLRHVVTQLTRRGVQLECIGVTGSLLLGAHGAGSDLDLVIRSKSRFEAARVALDEAIRAEELQPLDSAQWRAAWQRRGAAIEFERFLWHQRRKGVNAIHQGTKIDLGLWQPVAPLRPGVKEEERTIRGVITHDQAAFETPSRWRCDHEEVAELLTWSATYCGQVRQGERFEARGIVERLEDGSRRLVVGGDREAKGHWLVMTED